MKTLKEKLEAQWNKPGVAFSLRPACWTFESGRLVPDDVPNVPDEDDSGPFYPRPAR
jgi:hypothetical protein